MSNQSIKYSELIRVEPLGLTTEQAQFIFGNAELFNRIVRAGWITPVVDRNRCRVFDTADIRTAWSRLKAGDYPEERRKG